MENTPNRDRIYMEEALKLARRGRGFTKTNPLVGAILVKTSGTRERIIGRGYHRGYGLPHAEVEAIKDARRKGHRQLADCILYVNLEPCCHVGKTPPCTDLIVRERIGRVVCGTTDPFPLVAGRGLAKLRAAGVQVTCGILEHECQVVNRPFFKQVKKGLPWVTVKFAQSVDGKIATATGRSKWISGESSRTLAHQLRRDHDAVLVGANTVLLDNPRLNVRRVPGRHPWRVVIDGHLRMPLTAALLKQRSSEVIVITSRSSSESKKAQLRRKGVHVLEFNTSSRGRIPLRQVLKRLLKNFKLASILVEGGASVIGQLFEHDLVDEVYVFVAPLIIGEGLSAVSGRLTRTITGAVHFCEIDWKRTGSDMLFHGVVL